MSLRNETWYAQGDAWQRLGQAPISPGAAPSAKPLVGASTTSDTSGTFATFEGQVGSLRIRRSFTASNILPATYAESSAGIDAGVRESVWSFKPTPATFAAGTNDAWFNAFLASIPNGQKVIFILWHEPEDNIRNGEFTLAEWKAANNHMGQLVHATGRSELRTAICLMGPWTFTPGSPYYTTDYWDSGFASNIDYIGYDPYNMTTSFWPIGTDTNFQTAMNWASSHDKQVLLPEFGSIDDTSDHSKQADWISDMYAFAQSAGMYAICYFQVTSSYFLTTSQALTAYANCNADSKV